MKVECCVQTSPCQKDTDLIFERDVNPQWAEGLEFCDTLVTLRRGAKPFITVNVQNSTDHEIVLTVREQSLGQSKSKSSTLPLRLNSSALSLQVL